MDSKIIDGVLITCEHPPGIMINTIFVCILFQNRCGISFGVNRERKKLYKRCINQTSLVLQLYSLLQFLHACGQLRTNRTTMRKEKVHYQNLSIYIIKRYI